MKTELLACRHAKGSDLKCWSFRNQAALTIKKLRLVMLFEHKCRIVDKMELPFFPSSQYRCRNSKVEKKMAQSLGAAAMLVTASEMFQGSGLIEDGNRNIGLRFDLLNLWH